VEQGLARVRALIAATADGTGRALATLPTVRSPRRPADLSLCGGCGVHRRAF
jgi:hypothetical protein